MLFQADQNAITWVKDRLMAVHNFASFDVILEIDHQIMRVSPVQMHSR